MSINLILDNPQAVYFQGQIIVGRVLVTTHTALSTRGVAIKLTGQANTAWSTGSGDDQQHYGGKEEYYTGKVYLFGNGTDTVTLNQGHHEYPFSFTLPLNIPASFESEIGQVRYQCKAKINIPWGLDIAHKQLISVNHIYDLNKDESALIAVNRKEKKTFTFSSGSIYLTLMIDRTGFVPGEKLRVHCELDNDSDKTIEYVKMKLLKHVVYYDQANKKGATYPHTVTIGKMRVNNITGRGKHVLWSNTGVVIPAVPPSYLQHCNLIDISYSLKLMMSPSGFTRNMDMEQPIIIGSIPLQQHFSLYQMVTNSPAPGETLNMAANSSVIPRNSIPQPSAPPIIGVPQPTIPLYPSLPNTVSDDNPPAYDPKWLNESRTPPVFPGFEQYPEMPPPVYGASQHSVPVPMDDNQHSNCMQPGSFIPSYVTFNPNDSRPGTPY